MSHKRDGNFNSLKGSIRRQIPGWYPEMDYISNPLTVGKKTVPMFGYFGKIDLPKNK
jgi:hypothetical protein